MHEHESAYARAKSRGTWRDSFMRRQLAAGNVRGIVRKLRLTPVYPGLVETLRWVEDELPPVGLLHLVDAETGQERLVDSSSPSVQRAFRDERRRWREQREHLFRRYRVDSIDVSTDKSYIEPLIAFFRRRERSMQA